jgi:Flp pilus assembly pilin Flp
MTASSAQLAGYLKARLECQAGQTLAEYGILISVIAIVVIVAAILLGVNTFGLFSSNASGV